MNKPLAHLLVVIVVVAGALFANALRSESTTFAFFDDTEKAVASFTGDVPIAACAAFWADDPGSDNALKITGSDHTFVGCIHSNGGIEITGSRDDFHRTLRYVTAFKNNSNAHTMRAGVIHVPHEVFPYPYTVSDYSPTGCKAQAAANQGKYFSFIGSTVQIKGALVKEGLYYVQGDAVVDLTSFTGNITVVATGKVNLAAGVLGARPYVDQLLAHAGASGPNSLTFTGNGGSVTGSIYAPLGAVSFSAQQNNYQGQVMGWTVTVSGSGSTFVNVPPIGYRHC